MGSVSDYEVMADAVATLEAFGVEFEKRVVSAHRTPDLLCEYAKTARSRGIGVIIAGAGGAAHLPGMVASMTTLPVVGVPVKSRALNGLDSLLSIVQMPAGVPVATTAINGEERRADRRVDPRPGGSGAGGTARGLPGPSDGRRAESRNIGRICDGPRSADRPAESRRRA